MAVLEIVRFRLAAGVDNDQFLIANRQVEAEHISRQPGFIGRETAAGSDGDWAVVVHWESAQAAERSMQGFRDAAAAQAFLSAIDGDSCSVGRYTVYLARCRTW